MKFHIIGINKVGLNIFNFLSNKKHKVTISDINKKIKIKKNNFYYGGHPKDLIKKAKWVIYCPGVIKNDQEYNTYISNKKYISEIDIFNKYNKWPLKNILFVTGSKGKTTMCSKIYKKLDNKDFYKKVFYADRKKFTFSNLPMYKKGFFLIAEVDYQTLLLAKSIKAKYRIFTSFFKTENKAFKNNNLYLKAKLKLFLNQRKKDFIFINNQTIKKLKINKDSFRSKIILLKSYKSIKENNNNIANITTNIIKKTINEKY